MAWICALLTEKAAAVGMLDEAHDSLPSPPPDNNSYSLGRIRDHNVVITCLPSGVTGTTSAARVTTLMLSTFTRLDFRLMVGIGSGALSEEHDIRLGDVVVSKPIGTFGGVIQYDFGKTVQEGKFTRTCSLNKASESLLKAVASLEAKHMMENHKVEKYLSAVEKWPKMKTRFPCPGVQYDTLYEVEYDHPIRFKTCSQCDADKLVNWQSRPENIVIYYGLIAFGNRLMQHGGTRGRLRQELDVLCFKMAAAGVTDSFPCLVIRGICDYAHPHKNKCWQPYAAITASAYTKELLFIIPGKLGTSIQPATEITTVTSR